MTLPKLSGILLFATTVAASAPAAKPGLAGHRLAFRLDDDRVLILMSEEGLDEAALSDETLPVPQAKLLVFTPRLLNGVGRARLSKNIGQIPTRSRWRVHLGGTASIETTIEAHADWRDAGCGEVQFAVARVASTDLSAFRAAREKYYLASRETPPGNPGDPGAGRWVVGYPSLSPERIATIKALLKPIMQQATRVEREKPGYLADDGISEEAAASMALLRTTDDAILRGEGEIRFDHQAVRVGPGPDPWLWIRAKWLVNGKSGSFVSLWLPPGEKSTPVGVETGQVELMHDLDMFNWQGFTIDSLGKMLNVFDVDRDGWGEWIIHRQGYEAYGYNLYQMTPTGPVETPLSFWVGC